MKNWIKFFSIFLVLLAVILTGAITIQSYAPFHKATNNAEKIVTDEELLTKITSSYVYSSKHSYVTVIGENANQQPTAVFVNQDDLKGKKEQVVLSTGISEKEAINVATKDQKVKKVLHAKLGLETPGVVWEVAYRNDKDQLNYIYVLFENGQWWKKITNL